MENTMLVWNSRSIQANKGDFMSLLSSFNVQIAAISETWLDPEQFFHVSGYSIVRCDRLDGYGGCAICIRKDLPYKEIPIQFNPLDLQVVGVKVNNISIISIYLTPSTRISYVSLQYIIQQLDGPFVLLGDMNAHNPIWGSPFIRGNGRVIERLLDEFDLNVLNNGEETMITPPSGNKSIIDLVICSPILYYDLQLTVLEDTYGSNHFPLLVKHNLFPSLPNSVPNYEARKTDWRRTDWCSFKMVLEQRYADLSEAKSPHEKYKVFYNSIIDAGTVSSPTAPCRRRSGPRAPWWDSECSTVRKCRRDKLKEYKKNPSLDNFVAAKRAMAQANKTFKKKKKEGFRNFCEELSTDCPISKVWNDIKRFRNATKYSNLGFHKISCVEELLDILTPPYVTNPPVHLSNNIDSFLGNQFSIVELENVSRLDKKSSAGPDSIHYTHLKYMPDNFKQFFVDFLNYLLGGGHIPEHWKTTHIVPLLKPGKDPALAKSYRPIALTPCILKTTEHIIKNRLDWWLERNRILPHCQIGYRKGKGTQTCLLKITTDITLSLERKQYAVAVFLDLSSAYDNVSIPVLAKKLSKLGVPSNLGNLILQLISSKTVYIKNLNSICGPRLSNQGIPQGSVLSPTLFNIYTYDIANKMSEWVDIIQYADDIVLMAVHRDLNTAVQNLNSALGGLASWLTEHNFTLSPSKSKAIIFSRKRNVHSPPIVFEQEVIPYVECVKYLGVYFDRKLKWNQQVNNIISKSRQGINVMRSISKTRWGADAQVMLMLYKAIVRPHIDYSSSLLLPLPKTYLTKLERIQFQALRSALGALRSSPTNALLLEAGEPPIAIRASHLASRQICKYISTNDILLDNIRTLSTLLARRPHRSRLKPIFVEQYDEVSVVEYTIKKSNSLPCYDFSFEIQIAPCPIDLNIGIKKRRSGESMDLNHLFNIKMEEKYKDFNHVFTDASKNLSTLNTGCGIYIPHVNTEKSFKIPEDFPIMYAELIAIENALDEIANLPANKYIILSDSLSGLQLLGKTGVYASSDFITLSIKTKISSLIAQGYNVTLGWIPGHSGIKGNEHADRLANMSSSLDSYIHYDLPPKSLFPAFKNTATNRWQIEWDQSSLLKGSFYRKLAPTVTHRPWFVGLHLSKTETATITRLRLNHTLAPAHLHRFNIIPSDLCSCGQVGDVYHLLFQCTNYEIDAINLYHDIAKSNTAPLILPCLLKKPSVQICKKIADFIADKKIFI